MYSIAQAFVARVSKLSEACADKADGRIWRNSSGSVRGGVVGGGWCRSAAGKG